MFLLEVAVFCPLYQTFYYTSDLPIENGAVVAPSFGARKGQGVVVHCEPLNPERKFDFPLKKLEEAEDQELAFDPILFKLALWIKDYYFAPIGEVFRAMLLNKPQKKKKQAKSTKRTEANYSHASFSTTHKTLTDEQSQALDEILANFDSREKPPHLLYGVTGSGKTEVYLQCIANVLDRDEKNQVLVLVPEIALTPQMVGVFHARFGKEMVAVLHSGLTEKQRITELGRIRNGQAKILIGARSAVFASFIQLKLLVIDEEHDASYKQTSRLHYHARDVAIVRGKLSQALVLLGSATPSLESYHNAQSGKYKLTRLTQRANPVPLPEIHLIRKNAANWQKLKGKASIKDAGNKLPFSEDALRELEETLSRGEQAMLLVNRRGYAFYLYDLNAQKPIYCPKCSITLTTHAKNSQLHCHYCGYATSFLRIQEEHPEAQFLSVGMGCEKAQEFLQNRFPDANIGRLDADTVSKKSALVTTLQDFRDQKIQVLVGTQMLAKGHDFPNVTLILICEMDHLLNFPDFRAGERAFQLLVQAGGRAGRSEQPGKVLIETQNPNHPLMEFACKHDYVGFAEFERAFREKFFYPPFVRNMAVILQSKDQKQLHSFCSQVEAFHEKFLQHFAKQLPIPLRIYGPNPSVVEKIDHWYRQSVLLSAQKHSGFVVYVQNFLRSFYPPPSGIRMHIDIDPQTML